MNHKNLGIAIFLCLLFVLYPSEYTLALEDNGYSVSDPSLAPKPVTVRQAKMRLEDLFKTLEDGGSKKDTKKDFGEG